MTDNWVELEVSKLKEADYNPRTISKERLNQLKVSLQKDPDFLKSRPLLVNQRDDGSLVVFGGNQRLAAVKMLGWLKVPCILHKISLMQEKAWNLKDNKEYGEWDEDKLPMLLKELYEQDYDLATLTGFDDKEINTLVSEYYANQQLVGVDDVPEPPAVAKSKRGEVYQLDSHFIMCGDSCNKEDVEKLMAQGGGVKANMTLTDPPYNIGKEYGEQVNDSREDYKEWSRCWFNSSQNISSKIIFTCGKQNLVMWAQIQTWFDVACWYKVNAMAGTRIANLSLWEPILFYGKFDRNSRPNDIFEYNIREQKDVGEHPVPKLLDFWVDLLKSYTQNNDVVYDPFLGSGSTLIACEQLNRVCMGLEVEPRYIDVILDRYERVTGKQAVREDGVKWQDIKAGMASVHKKEKANDRQT